MVHRCDRIRTMARYLCRKKIEMAQKIKNRLTYGRNNCPGWLGPIQNLGSSRISSSIQRFPHSTSTGPVLQYQYRYCSTGTYNAEPVPIVLVLQYGYRRLALSAVILVFTRFLFLPFILLERFPVILLCLWLTTAVCTQYQVVSVKLLLNLVPRYSSVHHGTVLEYGGVRLLRGIEI